MIDDFTSAHKCDIILKLYTVVVQYVEKTSWERTTTHDAKTTQCFGHFGVPESGGASSKTERKMVQPMQQTARWQTGQFVHRLEQVSGSFSMTRNLVREAQNGRNIV
jgi:hypothetical protein